ILGTGTGGGLVVDGRPLTGPNAIAGEWGHNPLPWATPEETPGPPCYCRKAGCIEVWCSGPGLAADFARVTGRPSTAEQIATDAAAGEPDALLALARYEDRLARALASVINIVDPDAIVLGGGLSNLDRLYTTLAAMIEPHVFSDRCWTPILKNKWGDSSGVRGAAWLWPQDPP
ncbi:MAG TPA: fructokinase, partial [Alphaproteobacteria bacterium]|nr:fructokinase [Alphaproteobacteria bacterium]